MGHARADQPTLLVGHFAEPKLRRALQMVDEDSRLAAYIGRQIGRVECDDEIGVYCGR